MLDLVMKFRRRFRSATAEEIDVLISETAIRGNFPMRRFYQQQSEQQQAITTLTCPLWIAARADGINNTTPLKGALVYSGASQSRTVFAFVVVDISQNKHLLSRMFVEYESDRNTLGLRLTN